MSETVATPVYATPEVATPIYATQEVAVPIGTLEPEPTQKKGKYNLSEDARAALQNIPYGAWYGTKKNIADLLQMFGIDEALGDEAQKVIEESQAYNKAMLEEGAKMDQEQGANYLGKTGSVVGRALPVIAPAILSGGGMAVAVPMTGLQEAADTYDQTKSENIALGENQDDAEFKARGAAAITGTAAGALTAAMGPTGVETFLSGVPVSSFKDLGKRIAVGALKETVGEEMPTTAIEDVVSQITTTPNTPLDEFGRKLWEDEKETAILSLLSGGSMEALHGTYSYGKYLRDPEVAKIETEQANAAAELLKTTEELSKDLKNPNSLTAEDKLDLLKAENRYTTFDNQKTQEEMGRLTEQLASIQSESETVEGKDKESLGARANGISQSIQALKKRISDNNTGYENTLKEWGSDPFIGQAVQEVQNGNTWDNIKITEDANGNETLEVTPLEKVATPVDATSPTSVNPVKRTTRKKAAPIEASPVLSTGEANIIRTSVKEKLQKVADLQQKLSGFNLKKNTSILNRWIKDNDLSGKVEVAGASSPAEVVSAMTANTPSMLFKGKTYVNPLHVTDLKSLQGKIRHEVGYHYGVSKLIQDPATREKYNASISKLFDAKTADKLARRAKFKSFDEMVQAYADKFGTQNTPEFVQWVKSQELPALYAEYFVTEGMDVKKGFISKIKDVVVRFLDTIVGKNNTVDLTENDIIKLLSDRDLTLDDLESIIKSAYIEARRIEYEDTDQELTPEEQDALQRELAKETAVPAQEQEVAQPIVEEQNVLAQAPVEEVAQPVEHVGMHPWFTDEMATMAATTAVSTLSQRRSLRNEFDRAEIENMMLAKANESLADLQAKKPNATPVERAKFVNTSLQNFKRDIGRKMSSQKERATSNISDNVPIGEDAAPDAVDNLAVETQTPEKVVEKNEAQAIFEQAKDRLAPRERAIYDLTAQGLSIDDIAKKLKISKRSVNDAKAKMIENLRGTFQGTDIDPTQTLYSIEGQEAYNQVRLDDTLNLIKNGGSLEDAMFSLVGKYTNLKDAKDFVHSMISKWSGIPQEMASQMRETTFKKRYDAAVANQWFNLLAEGGKASPMLGALDIDKAIMKENRKKLDAVLKGDEAPSSLPKEMRKIYATLRREMMSIGRDAVKLGLISEDQFKYREGIYVKKFNQNYSNFGQMLYDSFVDTYNWIRGKNFDKPRFNREDFNKMSSSDAYLIFDKEANKGSGAYVQPSYGDFLTDAEIAANPEIQNKISQDGVRVFFNAEERNAYMNNLINKVFMEKAAGYLSKLKRADIVRLGLDGLFTPVKNKLGRVSHYTLNQGMLDQFIGGLDLTQDQRAIDKMQIGKSDKYVYKEIKKLYDSVVGRYQAENPMTRTERVDAGEIEDVAYNIPKSILTLKSDIEAYKMFREMRNNPEFAQYFAQDQVDDSPLMYQIPNQGFGDLGGLYTTKAIHDMLIGFKGASQNIMPSYIHKIISMWKSGFTVLNPKTHMNNILGNALVFSEISGTSILNPHNWKYYNTAIKHIMDENFVDERKEYYLRGMFGGDFSSAELKSIDSKFMESIQSGDTNPITALRSWIEKTAGVGHVYKAGHKTSEIMSRLYAMEDEVFKVAAYIKAKEKYGGDERKAANHVRRWFPFYDNLPSNMAVGAFKFLYPFGSFMYESTRIAKNIALDMSYDGWQAKGKIMAIALAIQGLNIMSRAMLGLDDDDYEDTSYGMKGNLMNMPIIGGAAKMLLGKDKLGREKANIPITSFMLPFQSKSGEYAYWDLGNVLPFGIASNIMGADASDENKPWLSSAAASIMQSNPILATTSGWSTGRDMFTGRQIISTGMTEAEKIGSMAQFLSRKFLPPWAPPAGSTWKSTMGYAFEMLQEQVPAPMREVMEAFQDVRFAGNQIVGWNKSDIVPSTMSPRSKELDAVRGLMFDWKKTNNTVRDFKEKWMKQSGMDAVPDSTTDSTPESRARSQIFDALLNKDQAKFNEAYVVLKNEKVVDAKILGELIKAKDPMGSIPLEYRGAFTTYMSHTKPRAVAMYLTMEAYESLIDANGFPTPYALQMLELAKGMEGDALLKERPSPAIY